VSEDSLAVEVTRRAHRDHSFLVDEHTLAHLRTAMWEPSLFRRATLEEWTGAGRRGLRGRVREKLLDLLKNG
jgi:trimethylamine---corrinoid protein Co-methyltransferase